MRIKIARLSDFQTWYPRSFRCVRDINVSSVELQFSILARTETDTTWEIGRKICETVSFWQLSRTMHRIAFALMAITLNNLSVYSLKCNIFPPKYFYLYEFSLTKNDYIYPNVNFQIEVLNDKLYIFKYICFLFAVRACLWINVISAQRLVYV